MQRFKMQNLDCPACADRLQSALKKLPNVSEVNVSYTTNTLSIETQNMQSVIDKIKQIEPKITLQKLDSIESSVPSLDSKKGILDSIFTEGRLLTILLTLFLVVLAFEYIPALQSYKFDNVVNISILMILYIIAGLPVFKASFNNIRQKEIFDENLLMCVATIAAICIGEFSEAVAVMLFFRIGEFLESISSQKARNSINNLLDIMPQIAHIRVKSGDAPLSFADKSVSPPPFADSSPIPPPLRIKSAPPPFAGGAEGGGFHMGGALIWGGNSYREGNSHRVTSQEDSINTESTSTNLDTSPLLTQRLSMTNEFTESANANLDDSQRLSMTTNIDSKIDTSQCLSMTGNTESNPPPNPPARGGESGLVRKGGGEIAASPAKGGVNSQDSINPSDFKDINPQNLQINDVILIKAGEAVPADCVIAQGQSHIDKSALNGESKPLSVAAGDTLLAGSINLSHAIIAKVTQHFSNSQINKIKEIVESASENKPKTQKAITRFAKIYTPIMFFVAVCVAVLPPLFFIFTESSSLESTQIWQEWIYRALVILMVSCPCALVLSVPLGYFGALGVASKKGVLIKGSNFLEVLADVKNIVFDKTGTLTNGRFSITKVVCANGFSTQEILQAAVCAEQFSSHPIARVFLDFSNEYLRDLKRHSCEIVEHSEIAGQGVNVLCHNDRILIGNLSLMQAQNIDVSAFQAPLDSIESVVHIAKNGVYAGFVLISDNLKPDTLESINALRDMGVNPLAILSGDSEKSVSFVARLLGIKRYFANLLPTQKAEVLKELMKEDSILPPPLRGGQGGGSHSRGGFHSSGGSHISGGSRISGGSHISGGSIERNSQKDSINTESKRIKTAFAGDGINDSIVLATSDVGISVSGADSSSDISKQSADVILTNPSLKGVVSAFKIARKIRFITFQNIFFVLFVKLVLIILGLFGIANMWLAVFGDVGVALLTLLNALRVMRI